MLSITLCLVCIAIYMALHYARRFNIMPRIALCTTAYYYAWHCCMYDITLCTEQIDEIDEIDEIDNFQ